MDQYKFLIQALHKQHPEFNEYLVTKHEQNKM